MLQLSLSESLQLEELLSFSFLFSPLESNGSYSFDSYLSKVKGKSSFYLTFLSQCIYTRGVDRAGDKTLFLIAHESLLFITVFFSQEPKDGGVVIPSIHDHWVYLVNKFPGAVNEWLLSLTLLLTRHCPNAINVCLSFQEKAPPFFVMILTYVNPSVRCWWFFFTCLIDWREFSHGTNPRFIWAFESIDEITPSRQQQRLSLYFHTRNPGHSGCVVGSVTLLKESRERGWINCLVFQVDLLGLMSTR